MEKIGYRLSPRGHSVTPCPFGLRGRDGGQLMAGSEECLGCYYNGDGERAKDFTVQCTFRHRSAGAVVQEDEGAGTGAGTSPAGPRGAIF